MCWTGLIRSLICRKWHELADWAYALRWRHMANTASAIAISTMALMALVRKAILTDMAPTWAKAAATAAAARKGMNMGILSGLWLGTKKSAQGRKPRALMVVTDAVA